MGKTAIEWCDVVWNPVTGCTKVSQGCKNCYAERMAKRFWKGRQFSELQIHDERLDEPLHWWKPRRVFVNSMSDLFHPSVPTIWLDRVFFTMAIASQHTFLVLTKRPEIMRKYLSDFLTRARIDLLAEVPWYMAQEWPLPNVWVGVSVEDQNAADERIPYLQQTPAAVRFVSCEPLLGPVDLEPYLDNAFIYETEHSGYTYPALDWVICGGESGPGARPMHPDWARSIREQCQAANVPFFFKQWGEWLPVSAQYGDDEKLDDLDMFTHSICIGNRGTIYSEDKDLERVYWCGYQPDPDQNPWYLEQVGKSKAGRLLDGKEWKEFPEVRNL